MFDQPLSSLSLVESVDYRKFVEANRKMNGSVFNFNQHIQYDSPAWWFMKRSDNFLPLTKNSVEKAVKDFCGKNIKCVPSFSFIRSVPNCPGLENLKIVHQISFNSPAVIIEQDSIFTTFNREILSIPINHTGHQELVSCLDPSMHILSYLEAFNLNRYASQHKVVITDWSDPESIEQMTQNDEESPIKSFVYFFERGQDIGAVEKFSYDHNLTAIGGQLEIGSEILFRNQRDDSFRRSRVLSFAFAGETIKSASFVCNNLVEETFRDRLLTFKESLNFPVDAKDVFGFLLLLRNNYYKNDHWGGIFEEVTKIFSEVKLMNINLSGSSIRDEEELSIHLIRIK